MFSEKKHLRNSLPDFQNTFQDWVTILQNCLSVRWENLTSEMTLLLYELNESQFLKDWFDSKIHMCLYEQK